VAGYNLAETGRHIEIAGACKDIFNAYVPINRDKKMAFIANFWTFRKKCENILTIPEIFLDVNMGYLV
jgi:hypothetical protein